MDGNNLVNNDHSSLFLHRPEITSIIAHINPFHTGYHFSGIWNFRK